jgi:hypothetical protein
MPLETRYIATLDDSIALRVACKRCGAASSVPVTRTLQPPHSCRACGAVLFGETAEIAREAFSNLQECIKGLLLVAEDAPFRIEFELLFPSKAD